MRAVHNQAIVVPRPDLEDKLAGRAGLFNVSAADMELGKRAAADLYTYRLPYPVKTPGFVEVVDVGRVRTADDQEWMPNVGRGSVCLIDMSEVKGEYLDGGRRFWCLPSRELRAVYLGPDTLPVPLQNMVLSRFDQARMVATLFPTVKSIILPGLEDGVLLNPEQLSVLKVTYETVLGHGGMFEERIARRVDGKCIGIRLAPIPDEVIGEQCVIVTVRSLAFRHMGSVLRLSPFEDIRGIAEGERVA